MTELILNNRPLNFGEYKTQIQVLKTEQLELIQQLTITTEAGNELIKNYNNLVKDYNALKIMYDKLFDEMNKT